MKHTIMCPDCNGQGHFSVVEGDQFKRYEACAKCGGSCEYEIDIPHDELCEILDDLFLSNHKSITKYL